MKLPYRILILMSFILIMAAACYPGTASLESAADDGAAVESPEPLKTETGNAHLPLLPPLQEGNANGIGNPLPGGAEDPFQAAAFVLGVKLPAGPETAVVEQHTFGAMTEAQARSLADQFGFSGPLYVQQIDPEFAPPEGEEMPVVFTAFDGRRLLNISDTGLTYEDRGVVVDYNQRPDFNVVKPIVEAQLKEWGLLDFPYELAQLPTGDLVIYRLIDGIRVEQNAFNFLINHQGEFAYFDYQPLRSSTSLGDYHLQSAEAAWEQLQTANGRSQIRYDLLPPPTGDDPYANFVNPRSWAFPAEPGQEAHLYMTPAVYEATDGRSLHLMYGDLTLAGDENQLAEIAAHLSDVLHVWGKINEANGAKTLVVEGWEKIDLISYETVEGTVAYEAGQARLHTVDGETYILAAAPNDLPAGLEGYVHVAAKRDTGTEYPVLDWMSISEKIVWPDVVEETPVEELTPVQTVTIESAALIYFTLYQTIDSADFAAGRLFVPVWKFTGTTDQNRPVTFWVPAVAQNNAPTPTAGSGSGSISGWLWHDLCDSGQDGRSAPGSTPAGCVDSASPLGAYHGDGIQEAQEPPIAGVVIELGAGSCPAAGLTRTTTTDTDISYSFTELPAGTYCVTINPSADPNEALLRPGFWTYPELSEGIIGTSVVLEEGENVFDINFGWDHQFLPPGEG